LWVVCFYRKNPVLNIVLMLQEMDLSLALSCTMIQPFFCGFENLVPRRQQLKNPVDAIKVVGSKNIWFHVWKGMVVRESISTSIEIKVWQPRERKIRVQIPPGWIVIRGRLANLCCLLIDLHCVCDLW
jgi:hypothetical protein